jgi:hypothetical protein
LNIERHRPMHALPTTPFAVEQLSSENKILRPYWKNASKALQLCKLANESHVSHSSGRILNDRRALRKNSLRFKDRKHACR